MRPDDDPLHIDESVRVRLTDAELRDFGDRARAGDDHAAEMLVRYGLFWCHQFAAQYATRVERRRPDPALLAEYASVARGGLVKASRRWEPDRSRFLNYATMRMRAYLRDFVDQRRAERSECVGLAFDVADGRQDDPGEAVATAALASDAIDYIRSLGGRLSNVREVILAHYGIDGEPRSLTEIASVIGIDRRSASRCHVAGLGLLREYLESKGVTHAEI